MNTKKTPIKTSNKTPRKSAGMRPSKSKSASPPPDAFYTSFNRFSESGSDAGHNLKQVSFHRIASIAAQFDTTMPPAEAIKRAFDLLVYASAGKQSFQSRGSFGEGIDNEINRRIAVQKLKIANDGPPPHINFLPVIFDNNGKYNLYVNFEEALTKLLGKRPNKEPKFIFWIMDYENITQKAAEEKIESWKINGMPAEIIRPCWETFPIWETEVMRIIRTSAQKGKTVKWDDILNGKVTCPRVERDKYMIFRRSDGSMVHFINC